MLWKPGMTTEWLQCSVLFNVVEAHQLELFMSFSFCMFKEGYHHIDPLFLLFILNDFMRIASLSSSLVLDYLQSLLFSLYIFNSII